jgi:lauroyl/myristoyl acyltransferase
MGAVLTAAVENLQQARRVIPVPLIPAVARRRIDKLWADETFRRSAEGQMEFLVGRSERAHELPELARAYAEHMALRAYLRFHPRAITQQEVRGIEHLTERDLSRGVLLSFMHHNRYDGMFASVARHGVELTSVMTPGMLAPDAHLAYRQHKNVVLRGTKLIPSVGGTEAIASHLRPGTVLAIAPDVAGRTPVTWLGRPVLGSFGSARIAALTDSPVVVVTAHREGDGSFVQVHPPLDPRDHPDPGDLLDAILRTHEPAILAWPEAVESPRARFGATDA